MGGGARAILAILVALAVTAGGLAAPAEPTVATLGTATPGGGFPVYGEAFAAAVHEADPARSGLVTLARHVLDGLGLDRDRDFQAVLLDRAGDGPAMVLDGRVATLWGGGPGWPGPSTAPRPPWPPTCRRPPRPRP